MAIDTEDKRRSALNEGILPVADGSVDQQDRPHSVWIYRGINITGAVTITNALNNAIFIKFRDKRTVVT